MIYNVCIMAVESRRACVERIVDSAPARYTVRPYYDTERVGNLWNMERILQDNREGVLILQDDVAVPGYFWDEAEGAVSVLPGEMVSFFMSVTNRVREVYEEGACFAKTRNVWGQANYYPKEYIRDYMSWVEDKPKPYPKECVPPHEYRYRKYSADDTTMSKFLRDSKRYAYLTLPSLVNHMQIPSALGHSLTYKGTPRMAVLFGKEYLRGWDASRVGMI